MESKLQVQVQIGDTRRVFLIIPPRTYTDLQTAILREIQYMEFGLMYENDEGEYVVLNDDPTCLRIAISGSKRIEGTDVSRLKLRLFEGSSPSVKTTQMSKIQISQIQTQFHQIVQQRQHELV